jgi:hypothetical protein
MSYVSQSSKLIKQSPSLVPCFPTRRMHGDKSRLAHPIVRRGDDFRVSERLCVAVYTHENALSDQLVRDKERRNHTQSARVGYQ